MAMQGIPLSPFYQYVLSLERLASLSEIEKIISQPSFEINKIHEGDSDIPQGFTPLLLAAFFGRADATKKLLALGAKVSQEGVLRHPITLAVNNGHFDVVSALLRSSKTNEILYSELIQLLFQMLKRQEDKERIKKNDTINETLLINQLKQDYFINIRQAKIIPKFKEWLLHQQEKYPEKYPHLNEYFSKIFPLTGYCSGLTFSILYKMRQSLIENDKNKIEAIWNDLRLISESDLRVKGDLDLESDRESKEVDRAYEELFREITILQRADILLSGYTQSDFVENIGDYNVIKGSSFSELFKVDELENFLSQYIDDQSIYRIGSVNHVIGLIKIPRIDEREEYVIYDANQAKGKVTVSNIKEVAEHIKKYIGSPRHPTVEFMINQYSLLPKKSIVDIKETKASSAQSISFLQKLYFIRLKEYNNQLLLYQNKIKEFEEEVKKYEAQNAEGLPDLIMPIKPQKPIHPINTRSLLEATPLYLACMHGNIDMVRWYIDNGADITLSDNEGRTPLWIAAQYGHADIVELLLPLFGEDYDFIPPNNIPAFAIAVKGGKIEVAKKFLLYVNEKDRISPSLPSRLNKLLNISHGIIEGLYHPTPLQHAASNNQLDMIDFLIQHGSDINAKFSDKPLPHTVNALIFSIMDNMPDSARRLLKYSTKNLNIFRDRVKKYQAENPLDLNFEGYPQQSELWILEYSLENALILQGSNENDDPLYLAIKYDRNTIAEDLIQAGADINLSLIIAVKSYNRKVVSHLLALGAKIPKNQDSSGLGLQLSVLEGDHERTKQLIQAGGDVNLKLGKKTLLEIAISNKDEQMIIQLIHHGAKLSQRDIQILAIRASKSIKLAKCIIDKDLASPYRIFESEISDDIPKEIISFLASLNPNEFLHFLIENQEVKIINQIMEEFSHQLDIPNALELAKKLTPNNRSLEIIQALEKELEKSKIFSGAPLVFSKEPSSPKMPSDAKSEIHHDIETWNSIKKITEDLSEEISNKPNAFDQSSMDALKKISAHFAKYEKLEQNPKNIEQALKELGNIITDLKDIPKNDKLQILFDKIRTAVQQYSIKPF